MGLIFALLFGIFLIQEHQNDKIFSIDKVKDEIITGDDELIGQIYNELSGFFLPSDTQTAMQFYSINEWISQQNYQQFAIQKFMQVADYYLIAQAQQRNAMIVTDEVPSDGLKKIKIPNVCYEIEYSIDHPVCYT